MKLPVPVKMKLGKKEKESLTTIRQVQVVVKLPFPVKKKLQKKKSLANQK